MYKGTTPTIPIVFEGVNLVEAKVFLSLFDEQKKKLYNFESGEDFLVTASGGDSVTQLSLTQEQTLEFGNGLCSIQGRWVFPNGAAGATQRASIQIQDVLMKGVISYD